MNPILINPKIESDKSTAEQLQQMKSYLFQFKEQIELLLMNIDSDNMSEEYKQEMSRKFADSKSMSEILQSAGAIKLQVEELGGTVSALTVTTNGIYNQINDPEDGILTELSLISGEISAAVKFGVDYTGFKITSTKFAIKSTGTFTVDSQNFIIDSDGNVTVKGEIQATSGNIGPWDIKNDGLEYNDDPVVAFQNGEIYFGSMDQTYVNLEGNILKINGEAVTIGGTNYVDISAYRSVSISGRLLLPDYTELQLGDDPNDSYVPQWKQLQNVGPTDYVISA